MGCSIYSDDLNMQVNEKAVVPEDARADSYRSAAQNPDVSRMRLDSLLRQRAKVSANDKNARKNFWSSFIAQHSSQHANAND